MKRGIIKTFAVAASFALPCAMLDASSSFEDVSADQPYESIWIRNVFDLRPEPPPPPPATDTAAEIPPPNVHLVGISTMLGKTNAFFMVQEKPAPGKPQEKERSIMLEPRFHPREGMLELVDVFPKEHKVRVKIQGLESTISFETNRASGSAPGPGQPQPPPGMTPPNFTPQMPRGNNGGQTPFGQRQLRTPPGANNGVNPGMSPQASSSYNGFNGNASAGYNGFSGVAASSSTSAASSTPNLTAEQATALFAAQHLANQNNPNFPPAPPGIAALLGQNSSGAQSDSSGSSTSTGSSTPTSSAPTPVLGARSSGTLRGFNPTPPSPP